MKQAPTALPSSSSSSDSSDSSSPSSLSLVSFRFSSSSSSSSSPSSPSCQLLLHDFVLQSVAFFLDAKSLAKLLVSCKLAQRELTSRELLQWICSVRDMRLGCSRMEQLRIAECVSKLRTRLEFEWGSVELNSTAKAILAQFAELIRRHPSISVILEGHCGIDAPNYMARPFSLQRAQSVLEEMVACGVERSRLSVQGFGKRRALAAQSGRTRLLAGEDINRRVEVFLVHDGIEFPPRPELKAGENVFDFEALEGEGGEQPWVMLDNGQVMPFDELVLLLNQREFFFENQDAPPRPNRPQRRRT